MSSDHIDYTKNVPIDRPIALQQNVSISKYTHLDCQT